MAEKYFELVSTVLDKQKEMYDLSVVSVNTTTELVSSLMRVMDKEVHARFLEESPLRYSSSSLQFTGFLSEGYSITGDQVRWMFELFNNSNTSTNVQAVLCLMHLESPYMFSDERQLLISSNVLHLHLGRDNSDINIKVDTHKSYALPNIKARIARCFVLSEFYDDDI